MTEMQKAQAFLSDQMISVMYIYVDHNAFLLWIVFSLHVKPQNHIHDTDFIPCLTSL